MKKMWALVFIFLLIGAVIYTNQQQKLQVYKIDVNGHDVYIHDLTFVNADNTLYLPSTYSFERKSDVALENVSVTIFYKEEVITDWMFELDQLKVLDEHADYFFQGITFNKDDFLRMVIQYKKNDTYEKLERDFLLRDYIQKH